MKVGGVVPDIARNIRAENQSIIGSAVTQRDVILFRRIGLDEAVHVHGFDMAIKKRSVEIGIGVLPHKNTRGHVTEGKHAHA